MNLALGGWRTAFESVV